MKWIVIGAVVLLIGAFIYWRVRRRSRHRLISLVALLREPATFDPVVLARLAGKAWNADLGDGTSEGADGFVAGAGVASVIHHQGRTFLINAMTDGHAMPLGPYVDNPEQVAESIGDLRIRSLFAEHKAWFSCDALGVDGTTPQAEVLDWYQRLGKLFAELLDENCLLILVPDAGQAYRAYPINEDTEQALRSDDPVAKLQETLTVPMIAVSDDDPLMRMAVEKARSGWPRFLAAFESRQGENFTVKAPVSRDGKTEFIWIAVTAVEGERIYGTLGNEPADLGPLKLGSKVSVNVSELNDWCYVDPQGNPIGLFTVAAVKQAARRGTRN